MTKLAKINKQNPSGGLLPPDAPSCRFIQPPAPTVRAVTTDTARLSAELLPEWAAAYCELSCPDNPAAGYEYFITDTADHTELARHFAAAGLYDNTFVCVWRTPDRRAAMRNFETGEAEHYNFTITKTK